MSNTINSFSSAEVSKLIGSIRPEQIEIVRENDYSTHVIFDLDEESKAKAIILSGIAYGLDLPADIDRVKKAVAPYESYIGIAINEKNAPLRMNVVLSYNKHVHAGEVYLSPSDSEKLKKLVDDRIAEDNKKAAARRKKNIHMSR